MNRARFAPTGLLAISADSWGVEFDCPAHTAAFATMGDCAVVTIAGPLMQHAAQPSLFAPAWDSYEAIRARVDAAFASASRTVVLKISSPGGLVAGVFELAQDIRSRAQAIRKRVIAYVDGCAASAAYALACAAEKIFVPATGLVGSIGTMQVAVDTTVADRAAGLNFEVFASGARKVDGNPHVAMSDEARAAIRQGVDEMAKTFFAFVATARGTTPDAIAKLQAAMFVGGNAVEAGLADGVKTLAEVIASANQINAQVGAEVTMSEEEKAKAALQAIADGDDEKAAARAKKALAAYESDDEDDKDKAKAEDSSEKKDEEKKDEEKDEKKDAEAKASGSSLALAASVQSLTARLDAREEKEEREKLMASRPDLAAEVVAFLERQPLAVLRDAVKTLPKGAIKAKGQIGAARAAMNVVPSEAAREVEKTEANDLDVQMGLAKGTSAIRLEGNRHFIGVMTPAEASAELARREAATKKGAAQ